MAVLAAGRWLGPVGRASLGGAPYLVAAHAAIVCSGFAFWLIAGRLTTAAGLGAGAAAISAAMLATSIAQLGLPQAILRQSREHGDAAALAGSALTALWVLSALAAIAAGLVVAAIPAASAEFERAFVLPAAVILGAAGVAQMALVWHVASAAGKPAVALAASGVEAALKVSLVAPLAWALGTDGVLLAWAASTAGAATVGAWILLPRFAGQAIRPRLPRPRVLAPVVRFSLASHVGDLVLFTPTSGALGWLIPLIVVARYGAEAGGIFYVVWSIAAALQSVPFALSTMTVASSVARGLGRLRWQRAALWLLLPAIPLALATAALASPLLSLFGPEHEAQGALLLRLLALGIVAASANAALSTALKLGKETAALHALGVAAVVPMVLATALLPTERGLEAIAVSWLLAQLGALAVALAVRSLVSRERATAPLPVPAEYSERRRAW